MRALYLVGILMLLCPAIAAAQAPPATANPPGTAAAATPRRGSDVTRNEYVARAQRNAERRFDRMDTDHDGVLTAAERSAYRAAHHRQRHVAAPAAPNPKSSQ